MATVKRAETAQELKEKYNKKRLTPTTAAQYYIYNYLYWAYLTNEGHKIDYIHDRIVKDETRIYDILTKNSMSGDGKAAALYDKFSTLCEWLNLAFESAILMRDGLIDYIMMFMSEATNAVILENTGIAGENIKRELLPQVYSDKDLSSWLEVLIEGMERNPHRKLFLTIARKGIQKNFCYLNAYNSLIDIIAKQIRIPELTFFQVEMKNVYKGISLLNDNLVRVREAIRKRGDNQDRNDRVSLAPPYTQEEKTELLTAYGPVIDKAPPIPEENLARAEHEVKMILGPGVNCSWSGTFNAISKNYWRA